MTSSTSHSPIQMALLTCALTVSCFTLGCGQNETPTPPPPVETTPTNTILSPVEPPQAEQVEVALTALTNSFKEASAQTQERVQEAMKTLETGNTREAVTKLKLIDADSELTVEQQESIRDVIRAHRSQLRPGA